MCIKTVEKSSIISLDEQSENFAKLPVDKYRKISFWKSLSEQVVFQPQFDLMITLIEKYGCFCYEGERGRDQYIHALEIVHL